MIFLALVSCNPIEEEQILQEKTEDLSKSARLVFSSFGEFEGMINEINSEDLEELPQNFIDKKSEFPKFQSLSDLPEKNITALAANFRISESEPDLVMDSISELVPDLSLRMFLNQDMEIEIEDFIYKVTPLGTFYTYKSNYEKLIKAISGFQKEGNNSGLNMSNVPNKDDVFFFDTFGEEIDNSDLNSRKAEFSNWTNPGSGVLIPGPIYGLPNAEYDKFKTYSYGAKTVIGKLIEGKFGGGTSFEENYNSSIRLRVRLYDFNYIFYKSLGLHAKLQKKGWTGIWALNRKEKAQKMVLGWDALLFDLKIPYAMPINFAQFPGKGVGEEILKFTNFSLPTGNITDVTIPFFNKKPDTYSNLEKMLKNSIKSTYSAITKEIWKEMESSLASASLAVKQQHVKSFRKVFPDEIKFALTRYEAIGNNVNELHFVIDRSFNVIYKSGPNTLNKDGSTSYYSFAQNVLEPTYKGSKKVYEIDAASVYGATVYNQQTKGIRIIKELND